MTNNCQCHNGAYHGPCTCDETYETIFTVVEAKRCKHCYALADLDCESITEAYCNNCGCDVTDLGGGSLNTPRKEGE